MKKLSLLLISLSLFAYSCSNDDDPNRIDIDTIAGDSSAEFIYFEHDKTQYYFPTEFVLPDFSNTYLNTDGLDQLNLNMHIEGGRYRCNIFVNGLDLTRRDFPITISQSDDLPGNASIQLIDQVETPAVQFGPDDDLNYVASSLLNDFFLTIESMTDEEISGTFTGIVKTPGNGRKFILLENGRFRIRLN